MVKPYLYWLFAPANVIGGLRQLAVQFGDGGEAELLNFTLSLSLASGPTGPVVAYGGCTGPVGEETRQALDAMLAAGQIPASVQWCRVANTAAPAAILASSHAATQARIDNGETPVWDIAKAMQDAGVAVHQNPME